MISRAIINTLLPDGTFWTPAAGDDYDKLLDGIADNSDVVYSDMSDLSCLRCPETTTILSDLEKEYGVISAALATDAERRQRLAAFMYRRAGTGAWDFLQAKLREAGFDDVYVHPNDPAVDPNIFLAQAFNMMCGDLLPGGNAAQCGEPEAICSSVGGELVVNGDLFTSIPNYINLAGENIGCGEDVFCGDFDGYKASLSDIVYQVPTNSGYWPLIFFVGGAAERRWRFLNEAVMNLPLRTDALDISGNGNNGTATDITWTGGVANFNGTSSYIDNGNILSSITNNFTISFNINVDSTGSDFKDSISFNNSNLAARFEHRPSVGDVIFYDTLHPIPLIPSGTQILSGITNNIFINITIICNGLTLKSYVNNVLNKTINLTGNLQSNYLLTGRRSTTVSTYMKMKMSNFDIFPRALTDEERMALYTDNAQTGGDGELSNIDFYSVPNERRLEFRRTILRFKPMHSWGGLIVIYS